MTEDAEVISLAAHAGLLTEWTDAKGMRQTVGLDTLKAVLKALDLPADSSEEIFASRECLARETDSISPLQIAKPDAEVRVASGHHAELVAPDGTRTSLRPHQAGETEFAIHAPRESGYYQIESDGRIFGLAVVPARSVQPRDLAENRKLAGIAVQIYSLRGGSTAGFGDFAALASFAKDASRAGVDAIMVSPVHAQFGAEQDRFTPYSPSTRLFLNPLFADITLEGLPAEENPAGLIDWRQAGPAKYHRLREAFERFREKRNHAAFVKFCSEGGPRLFAHALFEALDAKFRKEGITGFRNWPASFRTPCSAGATAYADSAPAEIQFQLFLQWLAARSAAAAQKAARGPMTIGIIHDVAVGIDPQGSQAWSEPDLLLRDLHVGAPPDVFNTQGQDWGLTSFSPRTLRDSGYDSFITMLRANMAYAGGVRIDHVLGLRRLWVLPAGASPREGVYLRYPQRELFALTALESRLHRAIVIGEDLGTVPEGFRDELAEAGILGMQVLWFERDETGEYIAPDRWHHGAAAMTTTHDLPTVAGWWSGHDIAWQRRLSHMRDSEEHEHRQRTADRERLWSALRQAGCAEGAAPPADEPDEVITGALRFIGKSRCDLAIAAMEDIAGEREQPNIPGTVDEHPNWRRRVGQRDLLHDDEACARLDAFTSARTAT